ncbi:Acetyl-CoA-benzylalcohol acetyltransferase [Heracleum sosnowskyi]|uniref:Acetyl-CoA-benzylalcohol acetyltransferase n=1 Tax=Heracleum sosnowskyi TaxID=360622 RepID=A0AAD8H3V4_9APIA|nr:Acetyl-CoA-benzylalcohol acetyltransferase [Heracleum sosnowskyi]
MEIQIISQKIVKPSVPTPDNLRNLKISFIDHLAPSVSVPLIFYYSANEHKNFIKSCENLEKSLSEVLTIFYPFAGRFIEDDLVVCCNDEGVKYVEAVVDLCLEDIIEGRLGLELLDCLVPNDDGADHSNSSSRPLVFIQVNTFRCGGVAVAVRGSHKIADAVTGMAFINAWASASRVGVHEVIPPSFVLPSKIPVRPSSGIFKLVPHVDANSKLVTQRYVFNKNAISALKLKAKAPVGNDNSRENANQFWVSKVEVVSAIIWKALISIAREKHGHLIPSVMVQNLNLRGRTSPLMPDNTCGNFYSVATARSTPDQSNIELHFLVALIRDAIRRTIHGYSKSVLDSDEFFSTVTSKFNEARDEMQRPVGESHFIWCSSWCKIPFYEADFGWGKPSWISNACRIAEMVTLQDTKSGEGVEAWVTLKGEDMIKFHQDKDVLAFTS